MKTFRIVLVYFIIALAIFVASAWVVAHGADLMLASGTTRAHNLTFIVPLSATRFQLRARPAFFPTAAYQNVGEPMSDLDARCVRYRQSKVCRTPGNVDSRSWHDILWGTATTWTGRVVESNRLECVTAANGDRNCTVLAGSVP